MQDLPETRDLGFEAVCRPLAGARSPESLDQEVARDDLVRVDEEHRQERPLLRPAQIEQTVLGFDLEGPKNPELHPLSPPAAIRSYHARFGLRRPSL